MARGPTTGSRRRATQSGVNKFNAQDERAAFVRAAQTIGESLPALARDLAGTLVEQARLGLPQGVLLLRRALGVLRQRLADLLREIDRLLGDTSDGPNPPPTDTELELCRHSLGEANQRLFDCGQEKTNLTRTLAERESFVARQQRQIAELQTQVGELEARLRDLEQRRAIEAPALGAALGNAIDAIQQGLTSLNNPLVDYGLQEFDLESPVNLEIGPQNQLLLRFPGLSEPIARENVSRLCFRLRPIPKSQQTVPGHA